MLALGALALVWGCNWVVMKEALRFLAPFQFSSVRFLLSSVAMFWLARANGQRIALPPGEVRPVVSSGLLMTVNFGFMMTALSLGGVGKTAVLVYTMPFWMLLLSNRLLGERVSTQQWWAIGSSALGMMLLVAPWRLAGGVAASVMASLAGLLWAWSLVGVKQIQARAQVANFAISFWQVLLGGFASLIPALFLEGTPIEWSPTLLMAMAYNILLGTVLAWWLLYYALERLSSAVAGLATLATPAVGVLSAWAFLGERPDPREGGGMVFIVAGLALLTLAPPLRSDPKD